MYTNVPDVHSMRELQRLVILWIEFTSEARKSIYEKSTFVSSGLISPTGFGRKPMTIPDNVAIALLLTIFAGLSTGIGSAIAYFIKKPKLTYLAFSLGLSAGVMIYISFVELLATAIVDVGEETAVLAFFIGILFIGFIDQFIPEEKNPHEFKGLEDEPADLKAQAASGSGDAHPPGIDHPLMRTGVFTALAIGIHNFPEGLATFGTALNNVQLGAFIALAVAIHNIPEGISVSMPIFYATNDRKLAFKYSFLSGVAEPIGAIVGFLVLLPLLSNDWVLPSLLSFVAGIMIYISLDELLPMAHNYGHGHLVISGTMLGMLIMAVSLLMI